MNSSYLFNSLGRIGDDQTDQTQRNIQNTKYSSHMLMNPVGRNLMNSHVQFATQQPSVFFNGLTNGNGLNGQVIDYDSMLMNQSIQERPLEKVQLMQRPFATVPFLGRGSGDSYTESFLQQGETITGKKSVSTIMEQSFLNYSQYVLNQEEKNRQQNPANFVEEVALNGWVRGGQDSREVPRIYH